MMKTLKIVFVSALLLAVVLSVAAFGASPSAGAVAGTVDVYRTKLDTDGPKNDGDVVISLRPLSGEGSGPVDARATMDQRAFIFLPHVLPVRLGTTVTFLNNDNDQHNVYFLFEKTGETLDIGTWGPGQTVDHTFSETGTAVTLCKLHLEMAAYIVVLDTPYFTTARIDGSSQRGRYAIDDVPPGKYLLEAWHKKLRMKGGAREITVTLGTPTSADITITKPKYAK